MTTIRSARPVFASLALAGVLALGTGATTAGAATVRPDRTTAATTEVADPGTTTPPPGDTVVAFDIGGAIKWLGGMLVKGVDAVVGGLGGGGGGTGGTGTGGAGGGGCSSSPSLPACTSGCSIVVVQQGCTGGGGGGGAGGGGRPQ